MKRVITIKGDDGDVRLTIKATVETANLMKDESERVVAKVGNSLFKSIEALPYSSFGVHNTTVSL